MEIIEMNENHFQEIIEIDKSVFQRNRSRKIENIEMLYRGNEKGCFVALENNKVIGYSFSKSIGKIGYFGPIGVGENARDIGIAKGLILKNIEYLKKISCETIGLEVLPEIGKNLNLYYKMGFEMCYPSLTFSFPEKIENLQKNKKIVVHGKVSDEIVEKIKNLTLGIGYDFSGDMQKVIENRGIFITYGENEIEGFIGYHGNLISTIWAYIKNVDYREDIALNLLNEIYKHTESEERTIRINGRYKKYIDFLIENNFRIIRSVNRMVLKTHKGSYENESEDFLSRAWNG